MFVFEKDKNYEVDYLFYSKHNHGHMLLLRNYNYIRNVSFSSIYDVIKGVSLLLSRKCTVTIDLNDIIIDTKYSREIFRLYPE